MLAAGTRNLTVTNIVESKDLYRSLVYDSGDVWEHNFFRVAPSTSADHYGQSTLGTVGREKDSSNGFPHRLQTSRSAAYCFEWKMIDDEGWEAQ